MYVCMYAWMNSYSQIPQCIAEVAVLVSQRTAKFHTATAQWPTWVSNQHWDQHKGRKMPSNSLTQSGISCLGLEFNGGVLAFSAYKPFPPVLVRVLYRNRAAGTNILHRLQAFLSSAYTERVTRIASHHRGWTYLWLIPSVGVISAVLIWYWSTGGLLESHSLIMGTWKCWFWYQRMN